MRTVVLDNEAVQALIDPGHPKHPAVVDHLGVIAGRRRRGVSVQALVPTSVRVEAGWDRTTPDAAAINRFRIEDAVLDRTSANEAVRLRSEHGVSVADAHLGQVARNIADAGSEVVVITSDIADMTPVAGPGVRLVHY